VTTFYTYPEPTPALRHGGRDALAGAEPLAVVDQAAGVAGDIDGELMRGTFELAQVRIAHFQIVHVAFEERDLLTGPIRAMPENG